MTADLVTVTRSGIMYQVRLRRVKDESLKWKAIYIVEGREDLWVESQGDPWDPTTYIGWNLVQIQGMNRHLITAKETLPEMRAWISDNIVNQKKRKVNGHAVSRTRRKDW